MSETRPCQEIATIYQVAPIGLCVFDTSLRWVRVNDRLAEINGYPPAAHIGKRLHDLLPKLADTIEPILKRVIETGEPFRNLEITGETPALPGERRTWRDNMSPVRDDAGRITGVSVAVEDITAWKRAEVELRKERAFLRHVVDAAPSLIFVKDWDGRFVLGNDALARTYGTAIGDLVGKTDADFNANAAEVEHFRRDDRTVMTTRQEKQIPEEPVTGADGSTRWFSTVKVPLVDEDGTCNKVLGVATDITARKRAEEALIEADRSKDNFLAVLSHELRNPLAPILSGVYVLRHAPQGSEPFNRALSVMERQGGHLARLVDDLLDLTRIAHGKIQLQRKRLDLAELVRETTEDARDNFERRGIRLEVSVDSAWVHADPTRIAEILGNLLDNALKFTPDGGRVDVALERTPSAAVLTVRDTGSGIKPLMLTRLFEPFSQADSALARSRGGLGLGLALARELVQLHGGSISAMSPGVDRGSVFTVTLPLQSVAETTAVERAPAEANGAARPKRVLLIEDNVDNAECLRDLIELMGHEVRIAPDGASGISLACAFQPEVVVCDIGLPDMSGYDVARSIRSIPSLQGVMLVGLTGYALPEDRRRAAEAGFDVHLAKPASAEKLRLAVAGELEHLS